MKIQIVPSALMTDREIENIISFCNRAYAEELDALFETFENTTHVLGLINEKLVSHAMCVTRYLQTGAAPIMRTAYVEMVATEKAYRRRGFAAAIMKRLIDEVQDYDLAALSPSDHKYYAKLGWELWQGPLFIRTDDGLLASPEDEEAMIYRLPKTPVLDLAAPLSAEWREGELW